MESAREERNEMYCKGHYLDFNAPGWSVRLIQRVTAQHSLQIRTINVEPAVTKCIPISSQQIKPFRTFTERLPFHPYAVSFRRKKVQPIPAPLKFTLSQIAALLSSHPTHYTPVHLIQLLRGRHLYIIDAFTSTIETPENTEIEVEYIRTHFSLLLYYLDKVYFGNNSLYFDSMHAFASAFPELYLCTELLLNSESMSQFPLSVIGQQWPEKLLCSLLNLCTGLPLQTEEITHISEENTQNSTPLNTKESNLIYFNQRIKHASVKFISLTTDLLLTLLKKEILKNNPLFGKTMEALYRTMLTAMVTNLKEKREFQLFYRNIEQIHKLLPQSCPLNVFPYVQNSTNKSTGDALEILKEKQYKKAPIYECSNPISYRMINFKLILLDSLRSQANERQFIHELFLVLNTFLQKSLSDEFSNELIIEYIRSRDIIKWLLEQPHNSQIKKLLEILIIKMEKEVIEGLIECHRISTYGLQITKKLSDAVLNEFINKCEAHRLKMKSAFNQSIENAKAQPQKLSSAHKDTLRYGQLSYREKCVQYVELYQQIQGSSFYQPYSVQVKKRCQKLILQIGLETSISHCLAMLNSCDREKQVIKFLQTTNEHNLFYEHLLLEYYKKKKPKTPIQKYKSLCEQFFAMEKTDPKKQRRRFLLQIVLCNIFEMERQNYQYYLEVYLTARGDRREEGFSFSLSQLEHKIPQLITLFSTVQYIRKNLAKIIPPRQDFEIVYFLAMFRRLNVLEKKIILDYQGTSFQVLDTPFFVKELLDCYVYVMPLQTKYNLHKLLQTDLESLLRFPKMNLELIRYFLTNHPTCTYFFHLMSKIRAKSVKKGLLHKDLIKVYLIRIKNKPIQSQSQMHHRVLSYLNKCPQIEFSANVNESLEFIKTKVADQLMRTSSEIVLYHNSKELQTSFSIWDTFGFTNNQQIMQITLHFALKSPLPLPLFFTQSKEQSQRKYNQTVLEYLRSQALQILKFLPSTLIPFKAISDDYTPFLPIFKEMIQKRTLLPHMVDNSHSLRYVLTYFIEESQCHNFSFLFSYLKPIYREDYLLYSTQILFLLYKTNVFNHLHEIPFEKEKSEEGRVMLVRSALIDCLFSHEEDSEEDDLHSDANDEQLYTLKFDLVLLILQQKSKGLFIYFLSQRLNLFFDTKALQPFRDKFLCFLARVYEGLTLEEKEDIVERIIDYIAYPNISYLLKVFPPKENDLDPEFHRRLLEKCIILLQDIKGKNNRFESSTVSTILLIVDCLLEKGFESNLLRQPEFFSCMIQLKYSIRIQCKMSVLKIYSYLCQIPETRKSIYSHLIEDVCEEEWEKKKILQKIKHRYYQPKGNVGLKNPHSVCYANSILQQLFHIKEFREKILDTAWQPVEPQDQDLLFQLKKVMLNLLYQHEPYINNDFFRAFKDSEGSPTAIDMQMDADEFRFVLLDRLEKLLPTDNNFIRSLFNGKESNVIKSLQCSHPASRTQSDFSALCVQVQGFKTLQDSLAAYFREQILEGDNAYECVQCAKKVRAKKHIELDEYPPYLTFSLKRFEYYIDRRLKLNTRFQFPLQEYQMPKYGAKTITYRLRGVVIHQGVSEAGHYISLVRVNEKWIEFNDSNVGEIDSQILQNIVFGMTHDHHYASTKNAYLLFYEQTSLTAHDSFLPTLQLNMEKEKEHIFQTHRLISKENIYFDHSFLVFQQMLCEKYMEADGFYLLLQSLLKIFIKLADSDTERHLTKIFYFLSKCQDIALSPHQQSALFTDFLNFLSLPQYFLQITVVAQLVSAWPIALNYIDCIIDRLRSNVLIDEVYYTLLHRMCSRDPHIIHTLRHKQIYQIICTFHDKPLKSIKDTKDIKEIKPQLKYHRWAFALYLIQNDPQHEMMKLDVKKGFEEVFGRVGLNYYSKLVASFCKNNLSYTTNVLQNIQESLMYERKDSCRKYLRVLKELASIEDDESVSRNKQIVGVFVSAIYKHFCYNELVLDSVWQWLLKIARKNNIFRSLVREHSQLFGKLRSLNAQKLQYHKSDFFLVKEEKFKLAYSGLKALAFKESIHLHAQHLKNETNKLLSDRPMDCSEEDSDADITELELPQGTQIRIYDTHMSEYKTATVKFLFGDYLLVVNHRQEDKIYHRAEQKLARSKSNIVTSVTMMQE